VESGEGEIFGHRPATAAVDRLDHELYAVNMCRCNCFVTLDPAANRTMAKPKKPQQQTLSVRISDTMRRRLERARELESAKRALSSRPPKSRSSCCETCKRSDSSSVDLIGEGPKGLLRIRHKAEAGHPLSRGGVDGRGALVQQASRASSAHAITVSRESLVP